MRLRQSILMISVALLLQVITGAARAAEPPMRIVVSVPGPRSLSYLPIDLIPKIGADKAEGASVTVRYLSGGGIVYKELMSRNADFGVAGTPAAMSLKNNGGSVVAIAPLSGDVPIFILMVRADLKAKVKTIADLKGRVIGIYTSSLSSKTVSQQLTEMVLRANGVSPELVRYVSAEHSYDSLSALFKSHTVDAVMGSEPFASRLLAEKEVYFLMNLADPSTAKKIPDAGFLHAVVATRGEVVEREPKKVEVMVKIVKRALEWMSKATPEQIVEKLEVQDPEERRWLLLTLKKYPNMYSPDGRFSRHQMQETERFFRGSLPPSSPPLSLEGLVDDRWSGSKK